MSKETAPNLIEVDQLAPRLANTFLQRRDLYARQLDDGRYVCIPSPISQSLVINHLRGNLTLGAYILDAESQARYLVFDADDASTGQRLVEMAGILQSEGIPSYLESSRRGFHLWLFFHQSLPAVKVRGLGLAIQDRFKMEGIELFPKQDRLQEGPGSLIRLPFGIHRKTGRRYGFLTSDCRPLAPTLREQICLLSSPKTVPLEAIERYQLNFVYLKKSIRRYPVATNEPSGEALSQRIKSCISAYDFIRRYVELTSAGRGLCPFHEDRVQSFAVNLEKNYWHCFAGCGGGSIIDFWMKRQDLDFPAAVKDLARMLKINS